MGTLMKVDFKNKTQPQDPWAKILHEHWPKEFNEKGEKTAERKCDG